MKKWMYLVFPGIMLAIFLVLYTTHKKEAEEREKARTAKLAADIELEKQKKKENEERARIDAEKRQKEREEEERKKEAERRRKQEAADKEVREATIFVPRRKSGSLAVIDGELMTLSDRLDLKIHPSALSVVVPKTEPQPAPVADPKAVAKLLAST